MQMERFVGWWKKEQRQITLAKALLLALLPITYCVVYCAVQGHWIGEVYLPSSQWNDELFYYKQVESILHYGYPLGYFGFNESHALKLSFAAWSPVLVFPWVIWGLVFGWNLMSPILCNIFLMSLCCFLFVWLTRPSWKQMGALAFLFCLYTPFARYMLSGMAEVICFAMLILFYSMAVNYQRRKKDYKLVLLFLLSGIMTLMRPYFVLFLLLPAFFWICRGRSRLGKWLGALGSLLFMGAILGIYACIKHYLGAEYFAPLFFTDWFEAFFNQGISEGIRFTFGKLQTVGEEFIAFAKQGIRAGTTTGTIFAGYLVCLGLLGIQSIEDLVAYRRMSRGREEEQGRSTEESSRKDRLRGHMPIEIHMVLSFIGMLPALLLMYKLVEGSRHLLTFIAAAVFMISLMEARLHLKALCIGVAFAFLYIYRAVSPYDYEVPFVQEERQDALAEWQEVLEEHLAVDKEHVPGYENVIVWTYSDEIEGEPIYTTWQLLYALPEGFGISCCMSDFTLENIGALKSHYLIGPMGGELQALCEAAGYRELHNDGEMILYEIK